MDGSSARRGIAVRFDGVWTTDASPGESIHLGTSVLSLPSTEGKVRGALCLFADLTEVIEASSETLHQGEFGASRRDGGRTRP